MNCKDYEKEIRDTALSAGSGSDVKGEEAPQTGAPFANTIQQGKNEKIGIVLFLIVSVLFLGGMAASLVYFFSDGYKIKKNMKHAERCFAAEEYKDSIGYYKAVLELDPTLTDVYEKVVEAYLKENRYEEAREFLKKGIKRNKNEEDLQQILEAKQIDIYQEEATYYMEQEEFAYAYEVLQNGIDNTRDKSLKNKKKECYNKEADKYLLEKRYEEALEVLGNGMADTGDETLGKRRVEIYEKMADDALEERAFQAALHYLEKGFEATGEEALKTRMPEIYIAWADDYLSGKSYLSARQVLDEGLKQTGEESLQRKKAESYIQESNAEIEKGNYLWAYEIVKNAARDMEEDSLRDRVQYLHKFIKIKTETVTDHESGSLEVSQYEFDQSGNTRVQNSYDAEGVLKVHREFDDAMSETVRVCYDEDGNILENHKMEYEYDATGRMTKKTSYGEDGMVLDSTEYDYDLYGTPVLAVSYIGDTNRLYVLERKCDYDAEGNMISCIAYQTVDLDEETREIVEQKTYSYEYDNNGNLSSRITYYEDGSIKNLENYNADGLVITCNTYKMGDCFYIGGAWETSWYLNNYDALGNVTNSMGYDPDRGGYFDYSYKYEYLYVGE